MRLIDAVGFGFGGEIVEGNMDLKEMIKVAAEMRRKHLFMLDISDKTDSEVAFITALVKRDGIYNFFAEVQDMTLDEIYVILKFLEAQDELRRMNEKKLYRKKKC